LNPSGPGLPNDALSWATWQLPTDRPSMGWFSGRMPHAGTLVRMKVHIHRAGFNETFFLLLRLPNLVWMILVFTLDEPSKLFTLIKQVFRALQMFSRTSTQK